MNAPLKNQVRWPSLARDLAILQVPDSPTDIKSILSEYGLTKQELVDILHNPYFQQLFQGSLEEVKNQGSKAGARYRALTLSQALWEKLFRDAHNGDMEPRDALKLLDMLVKVAGLADAKETTQVNTQVNVAVPLPLPKGVAKVAHALPVE